MNFSFSKIPKHTSKPAWLKSKLVSASAYHQIKKQLNKNNLHTICESGCCPNRADCWSRGTATFMILGEICTRSCKFCAVKTGNPVPVNENEPLDVAKVIKQMQLKHCVITSVTRDDIDDGGADIWARTVTEIRQLNHEITIETLIPDFNCNRLSISKVLHTKPDIVSHNIETVKRLNSIIRSRASFANSMNVIQLISEYGLIAKSGLMVGLGETDKEVYKTLSELREKNCTILSVGQYLQPTKKHLKVHRYVSPDVFENYKQFALSIGFVHVESSPLTRSSYHSERQVILM